MAYLTRQVAKRERPARRVPLGAVGRSAWACSTTRPTPTRPRRPGARLDLALRLGRRLPRRDEGAARPGAGRGCARGRSLRGERVRRHRARRGAGVRGRGGPRRVGQEHLPAAPRARVVVLPGRDRERARPAARRAAAGPVRQLHRLPRRLPDRRAAGALRARRDALHQLPDHRGEGRDPRGARARASAATSSAATSARTCARGTGGAADTAAPRSSHGPGPSPPTSRSWPASTTTRSAERFRRSPVSRAKRRGLLRNVAVGHRQRGRDPAHRPVSSSGSPRTRTPSCASTRRGRWRVSPRPRTAALAHEARPRSVRAGSDGGASRCGPRRARLELSALATLQHG